MATITSNGTGGGNWDTDATWSGGSKPVDDYDVVIAAGDKVVMDADTSGFDNGIAGIEIQGGAIPGELILTGATGKLKIKTDCDITGTNDTNNGRLLINSDGVWGNSGALPNTYTAIIEFNGIAAGNIDADNLDIRIYCTEPTLKSVRCYGSKYDFAGDTAVDPSSDKITLTGDPGANGTAVMVYSAAGTLPTGLSAETLYYIRDRTDIGGGSYTVKLATTNSDSTIVDITADGSGTCTIYKGFSSGSAAINVLDDVTSDEWAAADEVVITNYGPQAYDQQRSTIAAGGIAAGQITLDDNVNSNQNPGARIHLLSRNVQIRSDSTNSSQSIIENSEDNTFQCQFIKTAWSGTTFYGYAISSCDSNTISGGTFSGNNYAVNACDSNTIEGGTFSGNGSALYVCYGNTIEGGTFSGNSSALRYCYSNTISGGTFSGNGYALQNCDSNTISGDTFSGNNYALRNCTNNTISGATIKNNTVDFYFPCADTVVKSGSDVSYNISGRGTLASNSTISIEDYLGTFGSHKVIDNVGDIIKTACDGTGDAPSQDPDGGSGYCVEASNVQEICDSNSPLVIIPTERIWLTAASHTITYKVQTTYAGITAGNLKLSVSYISTTSPVVRTVATNAPAISQRSGATDWTQTLAVTITPSTASFVDCKIELFEHQSGNEVYIWPTPVIS